MKRRYFIVEGFKKISDLKKDVDKQDKTSDEEKMKVFRGESILANMGPEKEEMIKNKISDILFDRQRPILNNFMYRMQIDNINYQLHQTRICIRITISIGFDGHAPKGVGNLSILYPDGIKELENNLSKELSYYDTKVIFNFIPSVDNKDSVLFCPPSKKFDERNIRFDYTGSNDLSSICYFLNSVEGLDFSYWTLRINKLIGYTSEFKCKTNIPLIRKFQKIVIENFKIDEIDVRGLLSEKKSSQLFVNNLYEYNGSSDLTGILDITLPPPKNSERLNKVQYCLDCIINCQNLGKTLDNFSKVYINVNLPESMHFEYYKVTYKYRSVFNELEKLLKDNYKGANELGSTVSSFHICKPENIVLDIGFDWEKMGVFPNVYREIIEYPD